MVSLDLASAHLSGQISGCIANLTSLSRINLTDSHLSGAIPEELGKLPDLQTLMLASNNLEGNIPDSLGSSMSLRFVNLANNTLSGDIPHSLANSYSLNMLILSRNNLCGEIPATLFANSSALTMVDLQMNSLTGPIPPFGKVTGLKFLCLTENFLSGSIPPSIGNVSSLTSIFLGQNKLAGLIPESLSHIPKLLKLDLSFNSLSGHVPLSVYNMSSLKYFSIGSNGLVGNIPSYIGYSLPNLQFLMMESNKLEGLIPSSLANTSNLLVLDLSNNSLRGHIPYLGSSSNLGKLLLGRNWLEAHDWAFLTSLANCTQLITLSLEGNILNGSLPRSVGNLSTNLQGLMLGANQISGSIPSTLGKLHNLFILNLSKNKLSGQIPSSIGNITQLGQLYLDDNNLSGNIPSSFGDCTGLLKLNLSVNNLEGSIPYELFGGPSLSLGVDLSHNNLEGEIPDRFGDSVYPVLLNVSNNHLFGGIPPVICRGIQQINLSRNNLSGPVPECLEKCWLEQLGLSYNNFEGPIPSGGCFANSSTVFLDGNKGLCSWSSTLALPICVGTSATEIKKSNHVHVPLLVSVLLIVIPALTIAFLLYSWLLVTLLKNRVFSFPRCDLLCLNMFCFLAHPKRREVQAFPCHNEPLKMVSYGDILKATNWFSLVHTISSTRTGSVYVGRFKFDKSLVAIKVYNLNEPGAYGSYFIECEVLRNTRHRNLMRPVTLCSTLDTENHEFKALIFKFMVNGSLERWLHPEQYNGTPYRMLSLGQRMCIATDVASALDYVHNQLTPPLVHCDLKPSNILLDDDMTARLGDFGSAKFLFPDLISPQSLVDVGGTIGYMAPEYGMGRQISTGGDVYSFGVLLLEMLTGKRPTDDMFVDDLSLHKFVDSMFPERVAEILDPHMADEEHQGCAAVWMHSYIIPLVALGLSCSMESPKDRPGMEDVCAKLSAIKEAFLESRD